MRGVNKFVIEVHPESEYFEKALLFLKPDKRELPQKSISDNAEKLLCSIGDKNSAVPGKSVFLIFSGIIAGSALTMLIFFIISQM